MDESHTHIDQSGHPGMTAAPSMPKAPGVAGGNRIASSLFNTGYNQNPPAPAAPSRNDMLAKLKYQFLHWKRR